MRIIVFLMIALLFSGCSTVTNTKLDVQPITKLDVQPISDTSFDFRDERPLDEKLTKKLHTPSGEIMFLGDDSINPKPPQLFMTWLEKNLSKSLSGKVVVLREFSIQVLDNNADPVNEQQFSNAAASTPGADPISMILGHMLVSGIASMRGDKTVRVWIGGAVGDKDFIARSGKNFSGSIIEEDVNSLVLQALDTAVENIRSIVPDSTDRSKSK